MNAKIIKKCYFAGLIPIVIYFLAILINPHVTELIQGFFFRYSKPIHMTDGYFPQLIALSLALLIPAFMMLRYAKKEQKAQLIRTSKMTLIAGWCHFALSWVMWLACIFKDVHHWHRTKAIADAPMTPVGVIDGVMHYQSNIDEATLSNLMMMSKIIMWIERICSILFCAVAVFLIVAFFISLKHAIDKRMRFKAELIKPVVALVILIPELIYWAGDVILMLVQNQMSVDQLSIISNTISRIYALEVSYLPLIAVLFMLVTYRVIKVKPEALDDCSPGVQAENVLE